MTQAQPDQPTRHGSFDGEQVRTKLQHRLRRIEGQVRGLGEMVEANRYCMDILTQITAAQEGLRAVGQEVIRSHLSHCVKNACAGSQGDPDELINELLAVLKKYR